MRVRYFALFLAALVLMPAFMAGQRPMLATPRPSPEARIAASVAGVPAGWQPIYRAGGQPWDLVVDATRGRVLVLAFFYGIFGNANVSSESFNLLVLGLSGTLLQNVTLSASVWPADVALDAGTGYAYVSMYNGTLYQIDPGAGRILSAWTYWASLRVLTVQSGEVFVSACCEGIIMRIDATTGSLIRNYTAEQPGRHVAFAADPNGRWLFVAMEGVLGTLGPIYRVDLTTGVAESFHPLQGTVLLSADGRRVWFCGQSLSWYWLSNDTFGWTTTSCPIDRIAENPVTGVLALAAAGLFLDDTGVVGRFQFNHDPNGPWQATAAGWTEDGRALVAVAFSLSQIEVGTWDGDPWLNATSGRLVNPELDPICFPIVSAGGLNGSSVVVSRDDVEMYRGGPATTQACFGISASASVPLHDGSHVGRVTGVDRVGRPLDGIVAFETDGTPPGITVTSANVTANVPYTLTGTIEEAHPAWVSVDGRPAPLAGNEFSASLDLRIGGNYVGIVAGDTVYNNASVSLVVRYWPAFRDNITNVSEHFQVSVPPAWTGTLHYAEGDHVYGAALLSPITNGVGTVAMISSEARIVAAETQATAYEFAMEAFQRLRQQGVQFPQHIVVNETVDGHPAATIKGYLCATPYVCSLFIETLVVSIVWQRIYRIDVVMPGGLSDRDWGATEWILASFHILSPTTEPAVETLAYALVGGILGTLGAVAAAAFLLWRGRLKPRPPSHP